MYTEELWKAWSEEELKNYSEINGKHKYDKRNYTHFDSKFWFPKRQNEIKKLLINGVKEYKASIKRTEPHSFSPFLKILIKTPRYRYQESEKHYELDTKIRPICFASHIDSLVFSFYSYCLTLRYESYIKEHGFDECILAYRSDLHLSNVQFAKEVFDKVREKGECSAIALDIKGYFDHIVHKKLKETWIAVLKEKELPDDQFRIFKSQTRYSYVNKNSIYKKFRGAKKEEILSQELCWILFQGKGISRSSCYYGN